MDGEVVAKGTGEAAIADSVSSPTGPVKEGSVRGGGVSAGQVGMVGACTSMQPVT